MIGAGVNGAGVNGAAVGSEQVPSQTQRLLALGRVDLDLYGPSVKSCGRWVAEEDCYVGQTDAGISERVDHLRRAELTG